MANNNAYVVTTDSAASGSTASGGGSGNAKYQISIGPKHLCQLLVGAQTHGELQHGEHQDPHQT